MKSRKIILQIVIGLALVTGGFFGGKAYQANRQPGVTGRSGSGPMAFGSPPAGSRTGQPGGVGGDNSGSITAKDDKSITIKLTSGSMKTIYYTDSTAVSKQAQGSLGDLAVGVDVSVMGTSNTDGSVAAKSIQIITSLQK